MNDIVVKQRNLCPVDESTVYDGREVEHAESDRGGEEAVCAITYESISAFPRDDVYATATGIQYHRPTLKKWLQNNDVMPHSNVKSPEDIRRIWPNLDRELAMLPAQYRNRMTFKNIACSSFTSAACLLGTSVFIWAHDLMNTEDAIQRKCRPLGDQGGYNECVSEFTGRMNDFKGLLGGAIGFAMLGVYGLQRYQEIKKELSKSGIRSMTDEEMCKADLGVEFYAKNV